MKNLIFPFLSLTLASCAGYIPGEMVMIRTNKDRPACQWKYSYEIDKELKNVSINSDVSKCNFIKNFQCETWFEIDEKWINQMKRYAIYHKGNAVTYDVNLTYARKGLSTKEEYGYKKINGKIYSCNR